MSTCPKCSGQNEEAYRFCQFCGARLSQSGGGVAVASTEARPSPPRLCATCGSTIEPGHSFCSVCGSRAGSSPSAPRASGSAQATREAAIPLAMTAPAPELPAVPSFRLVALTPDGRDGEVAALSPGRTVWGRGAFPVWAAGDAHLSPKHAAFSLTATAFTVEDLGSLNGVFIRLRAETELRPGDVFRVGQQVLRFETVDQAEIVQQAQRGDSVPVFGSPLRGSWGRLVQVVAAPARVAAATLLSGTECVIGRERGNIAFPYDGFVSSTHAVITNHGARVTLTDRGSSNGTFWRIREPTSLRAGDVLLLGQRLLRVDAARAT